MESLPEGCIASILSRTTPEDVCRLSLVSKTFCSAADSDTIWDRFLPSDFHSIVSLSPSLANASSKKALYLALSIHLVIIDDGKKSFQLDMKSGKKCYMLGARSFSIDVVYDERHWRWTTYPKSRFPEVAMLGIVRRLVFRGMINKICLSPNTQYGSYLVFRNIDALNVHKVPVLLAINTVGGDFITKMVSLDPDSLQGEEHDQFERLQGLSVRSDDWLEIEMGEFFNSGLEDEEVHMSVAVGYVFTHLIIEGIEIRPKKNN
ncbi:F-box protein PP2-B10-like [Lotus japonicus]|uniref:F-box protein PP2-B10-like n=1 Tax=Lotus japonicus TaxID=34305 RepID=UPI00258BB362|nr:F-box protein PP2-B10-like [Lotus japonicus]